MAEKPLSERERNERMQAGAPEAADNLAAMIRAGQYEDAEKTLRGIGEYLEHLKLWARRG